MGSVSHSRTAPRNSAVSKGLYEAWGRIIRWANIAFMCPHPQSASDNLVDDVFQNVFFLITVNVPWYSRYLLFCLFSASKMFSSNPLRHRGIVCATCFDVKIASTLRTRCVCVVLITHSDYSPEELLPFGLPNGDAAFYVRTETTKYKRRAQIYSSVYGNIY